MPEPEAEKVGQHRQHGAEQSQVGAQQEIEQGRGELEKKEGDQGQGNAGQVIGIDPLIAFAPGAVGGQLFHAQELLEAVAEILVEDVEVAVAGQGLADGQVVGLVPRQGDAALRQHGGGEDEKQLGADKNSQQPFFQAQGIEAEKEFARSPQPAGQEEQREKRGQQQQVPRAQAEIAAVPIEQAHGPEQQAGGEGKEAAAAVAERRPLRLQQGEQE